MNWAQVTSPEAPSPSHLSGMDQRCESSRENRSMKYRCRPRKDFITSSQAQMKGHWGPSLGTQTQWWQELSCYPVSAADSWWDFGNLPTSPSLGVTIWNVEKPASKVWESMTTTHGQAIKGNHYNFLDCEAREGRGNTGVSYWDVPNT